MDPIPEDGSTKGIPRSLPPGVSQEAFARRVNLAQPTVSRILSGTATVSTETEARVLREVERLHREHRLDLFVHRHIVPLAQIGLQALLRARGQQSCDQ